MDATPGMVMRADEEAGLERRTGWLELFFDLVVVAAIGQVTTGFGKDMTAAGLGRMLLVFVPLYWTWNGFTFYNDRFETDDAGHRFRTLLMVVATAALACTIGGAFGSQSAHFAVAYAVLRVILTGLWLHAGYLVPAARPLTTRYAIGFTVAIGLWLGSLACPAPLRYSLWALAIVVELGTPLATLQIQAGLPRLSRSHLSERLGLLTLIVLGESVVAVVNGLAGQDISVAAFAAGMLGLGLAFSFWWAYFVRLAGRLPENPRLIPLWVYTHMGISLALAALGPGVLAVIRDVGSDLLPWPVRAVVCGASALFYLCLGVLTASLRERPLAPYACWLAAGLAWVPLFSPASGLLLMGQIMLAGAFLSWPATSPSPAAFSSPP